MHFLEPFIDQTLLKSTITREEMAVFLDQAAPFSFASICIPSLWISFAKKRTHLPICSVVAFPLGNSLNKVGEAAALIEAGVDEIDMVMHIGYAKEGAFSRIEKEVAAVARLGTCLKVIIESALLTSEEILGAAKAIEAGGAQFVKTSTGFEGGATVEGVKLIRTAVSEGMGIKASGGIRDRETAEKMLEAGATRLGTSSGIKLLTT
ncbi:MAG: deoxyribose-phosphate aldolase [Chlamydiia bacterium]|nr:deoxyribose-phosphate aldolase [Chlamydiia bacterium]